MRIHNLTNSPQMIGKARVPARGVVSIDLPAHIAALVRSSGYFEILGDNPEPVAPHNVADEYDDMDDEARAAAYEERFGSAPHHRMKRETIAEWLRG